MDNRMRSIMQFEENSRLVMKGSSVMTPGQAARTGAACAFVNGRRRILAAHSGEEGASALALAFASGAAGAGAEVILAGECVSPGAAFAGVSLECVCSCFVHTEITSAMRFYDSAGLGLFSDIEEGIIDAAGHINSLPYSHWGRVVPFGGTDKLYEAHISGGLTPFAGIYADVSSSSRAVMDVCREILRGINDKNGKRIAFHINGDCSRISAYSEETGYVTDDRLRLICYSEELKSTGKAAVCGKPSRALTELARKHGGKVISCGKNICPDSAAPSEECLSARKLLSFQSFAYDGIALMTRVMTVLSENGMTLKEALSDLPSHAVISRFIPIDRPSELLRRLCSDSRSSEDGVLSDGEAGCVTIKPVRTGKGVMLNVESYGMEAAEELCAFYEKIIHDRN